MTDKELLSQLKKMTISPTADWKADQRNVLFQQVFNGQEEEGLNWTSKFNLVMGHVFQPTVVAVIIFVFLASAGLAGWTSGNAEPGDSLYIAKRLGEKTHMSVTFSDMSKTKLNVKFATERARELNQIDAKDIKGTAKLKDDFKNEINQAKERLAKITEPKPELNPDEVQFFSAGANKDDERIDISFPEQDVEKILKQAGELIDQEDYEQAVEKLDQADGIINTAEEEAAEEIVE
ncbi:MAG: DUF5667 domain-containing protein [bacterium]